MKKKLLIILGLVITLFWGCSYDDGELWTKVNELDGRLTKVENLLSQMNGNVTALQTLVNSIKDNVYITNFQQTSNGYTITFSNGKTVTIYNGESPFIGENGNWWIGKTDTGVKARGDNGLTPNVGDNGNWWIGNSDTGVKARGEDGKTPYIGDNGNWWIGTTDTGVKAKGENGLTPHIGDNGHWWIGDHDTGVRVNGSDGTSGDVTIIGIDIYNGVYYWTKTVNGYTTWLLDKNGNKLPVSGFAPIFKVDAYGYLIYSIDGGVTWLYIYDENDSWVRTGGNCSCTQFFKDVYISGEYLILVLNDGTIVKIPLNCNCGGGGNRGDIPNDPIVPSPNPNDPNVPVPYPNVVPEIDEWGNYVITMHLTGIQDPNTGEWLNLYGTGWSTQNVWVDVDGSPKGIHVLNLENNTTRVKNDIVFTVDNSGSMADEANAIANGIVNWANLLNSKGLDVQFGVVGFGGNVGDEYNYLVNNYGVTGAMDLASSVDLNSYLKRSTGTDRTKGFYGSRSSQLQNEAAKDKWSKAGGENGAQAIRFANENFTFRATANRIYVNFTDDCNFTGCNDEISVNYFKNTTKWPVANGTIHSVVSRTKSDLISRASRYDSWELPWLMSEYTNGTIMFVMSDASDLQLNTLTVSDAITHAYTIRFIIPGSLMDGRPHIVRIVVLSNDGSVRGVLEFSTVFGSI